MLEYVRKTDDLDEMLEIAHKITKEKTKLYTPLMMEKMMEGINSHIPNASDEEKEVMLYRAIYDWWTIGANVDEEFYLHLYEKTYAEKEEYLVHNQRHQYVAHLNSGGAEPIVDLLENKYQLYRKLKPYYKRDIIQIQDLSDYPIFEEFVKKHPEFVVKPVDFYYGIGVHKASLEQFGGDPKKLFQSILGEGAAISARHTRRASRMVLEELIVQDENLAVLHRESVNGVRATAVRGKDGKIHIYHPWIKVGVNGTFVASAALDGFDAEVDPETGVIITDGYQESGNVYKVHPDSGITIKGYQIARWDELVELVDKLMAELPEYGYVGWDLVLTQDGWVVMEGNYSGEFTFQLINGRGFRKEFEELIGWRVPYDFWWQHPRCYLDRMDVALKK